MKKGDTVVCIHDFPIIPGVKNIEYPGIFEKYKVIFRKMVWKPTEFITTGEHEHKNRT